MCPWSMGGTHEYTSLLGCFIDLKESHAAAPKISSLEVKVSSPLLLPLYIALECVN